VERWVLTNIIPTVEFHQNRYARELDRLVRPGICWLDIGAGKRVHSGFGQVTGQDLACRAALLVGCDVVVEQLQQNELLTWGVAASGEALPFADGIFDLVTANMVLEHLADPAAVFREVARVLSPGGAFAFVTPNRFHPGVWIFHHLFDPARRRRLAHRLERRAEDDIFPTYYHANSMADLARLCSTTGLRQETLDPFPSYPMIRHPALLTLLEALWIRSCTRGPLRRYSSNIFGCVRRA
jgi:SAM-dependent methyltransferase